VAFFPDCYEQTNGVARTSRALVAAAATHGVPVLCVRAGPSTASSADGQGGTLTIARGPVAFPLARDLRHDFLLWRHSKRVLKAVRAFRADVVHITGPSDVGQLGALVAHQLALPLVGSWHTNLHDFAAWRAEKRLGALPSAVRSSIAESIRRSALWATLQFYRRPRVLMAPNQELVDFLRCQTGKPTYLMHRGVDTTLFSPAKRTRDPADRTFLFGFVGRLASEKNVRLLSCIERALLAAGHGHFRFLIVGDGSERGWLERHMIHADFAGVLHGDALARAYADIDLLIFPSETDTFGNVVQESLAAGTPALVSSVGGPKFIVRPGVSGFIASDASAFIAAAATAMTCREPHRHMRAAARQQALHASWDKVFDEVVHAYEVARQ
jgi:glycosyltransferase involved in cell wall biosynthesis